MSNTLCQPKWKKRSHETNLRHLQYLATPKGKQIETLLIGSSMFERFFSTGKNYYNKFFIPRKIGLAGVGGDRVQNMLYRIEQGLLEACPKELKYIVLQAGTNNVEDCTVEELVTGVQFLVEEIKRRLPNIKIILFGLAPRDAQKPTLTNADLLNRIKQVNVELKSTQNIVEFVDIFDLFLTKTGTKDAKKYVDHVHFNAVGYGIFAKAIVNAIDRVKAGEN